MPTTIGQMRDRVALQVKAAVAAGGIAGTGFSDSFTPLATVWARVEELSGGRYVATAGSSVQTAPTATHRVTVRVLDGWRTVTHLEYSGRRLVVRAARALEDRVFVEFLAEEERDGL
ncbi:MAG TPA: head-tail adaptor protein [Azospirillaceae bacterium]|nr:head-tail adaptor protein [Azospirillaceae bacterium]